MAAMTFPVWISIGPLKFHPHFVFELLAYATGLVIYIVNRRSRGDIVDAATRWSLLSAAVVGAVIGGRVLSWFEEPSMFFEPFDLQRILGGQTIVGALIGAWIGVEIVKRYSGICARTGDLFAVPIAAGAAIGRIGCFLSGLPDGTYGLATTLPWGIDLGDGVRRHPTALYESMFMACLAIWLQRRPRRAADGTAFRQLMLAYFLFRLAVDGLKPGVPIALGLTAIQWACVAGSAYSFWSMSASPAPRADPAAAGSR